MFIVSRDVLVIMSVYLGLWATDCKTKMLFIDPKYFGTDVGMELIQHVVEDLGVDKIDVNEQNPRAYEFYKHMGFKVVKRSPLDSK